MAVAPGKNDFHFSDDFSRLRTQSGHRASTGASLAWTQVPASPDPPGTAACAVVEVTPQRL